MPDWHIFDLKGLISIIFCHFFTRKMSSDHRLQAIITALKDENKKLRDENNKLQDEIKRKEEYRRLYVVWDDSA